MKRLQRLSTVAFTILVLFTSILLGANVVNYEVEANTDSTKHFLLNGDPFFPIGWYGGPGYENNFNRNDRIDHKYDPIDDKDDIIGDENFLFSLINFKNFGSNTIFLYECNRGMNSKRLGNMTENFSDITNCEPTGWQRALEIIDDAGLKAIVEIGFNTVRRNYWREWMGSASSAIYRNIWLDPAETRVNTYDQVIDYDSSTDTEIQILIDELDVVIGDTLIPHSYEDSDRSAAINKYLQYLSTDPAVFLWSTYDEPSDTVGYSVFSDNSRFTFEAIKNRMIKANTAIENYYTNPATNYIPVMPVFRVYPDDSDPIKYIYESIEEGACKYISLDWYPVWSHEDKSAELIPNQVLPAIEIAKHFSNAGPFIYVAQGHENEPSDSTHYLTLPSEKNLRYMTYSPIIHGARGIMFYKYYNNTLRCRDRVHAMIAEITGTRYSSYNNNNINLTSVIINGQTPNDPDFLQVVNRDTVKDNNDIINFMNNTNNYPQIPVITLFDINYLVKERNGYYYLFISNDSKYSKTAKLFSKEISYGNFKEITKSGLGSEKKINHGKFSITLESCEAKVFKIEKLDITNAYDIACLTAEDDSPNYNNVHIMRPCSTSTPSLKDKNNSTVSNPYNSSSIWTNWNDLADDNLGFNDEVDFASSGDFNNDGLDDIALFANNRLYLLNNDDDYFNIDNSNEIEITEDILVSNSYISFCAEIDMISGDFDADGIDEVCIIENATLGFDIKLINIDEYSCSKIASRTSERGLFCNLYFSASGDFDANGQDDIILFYKKGSTNYVKVFSLNENDIFEEISTFNKTTTINYDAIEYLEAGDMNNDGYSDFVLLYDQGNSDDWQRVLVFESDGDNFPLLNSPNILVDANWHVVSSTTFNFDDVTSMVVADLTGDANDDILVTYNYNGNNQKFIVYENDSTGTCFRYGSTFDPNTKCWGNYYSSTYDLSNQYFVLPGRFMYKPTQGLYKDISNDEEIDVSYKFNLKQNYPNPFNPSTTFEYEIPNSSHVMLNVYDMNGRLVEKLVNKHQQAGQYQVKWDASHLSSGMYIYRIISGDNTDVKKCMLIK